MTVDLSAGRAASPAELLSPARFDAILFDLDGVLTATASVHADCWKETFDRFLRARSDRTGEAFRPFDADGDYKQFVDGKSRYEGVRSFLASRGITLPEGTPASPPGEESVCGLGSHKDELVRQAIDAGRAKAFPHSIAFVRWARRRGLRTAVVSSSHHCATVLAGNGIENLFDVRVDGQMADRLRLAGKPAADTYLHAAKLLGVAPPRAVVIEDAISGVQAGRAGGFGLVIGVDRGGSAERLRQYGADLVVSDLGELNDEVDAKDQP